ncbi:MAG: hypothetical protein KJP21_07980 [Bacteroidia bacterium]|nr:hypothetical protein [Bacteroidia bacterium]NNJ55181.1 hypothetical protein [Bacteroidia bacterium]
MLEIVVVDSRKKRKQFHQFTRELYKEDKEFISHIDQDIEAIFSPDKNASFTNGKAKRWLAIEDEKIVGKIAAFYNEKQSGIGFFDCINNQFVANALFIKACKWLKDNGQTSVEAPVNFGERDKYWGLLVEGFENPSYQEPYNFPYYKDIFENFGFVKEFEQTTSEVNPSTINPKIFERYRNRAAKDSNLQARHFKFNEMDKYVRAFVEIYNKAWQQHEFFIPLTVERVTKLFKEMKPILREDIMWFVFDEDKPVAFYISIIDVNQIFRHVNGNLNWLGKLKFLWYRWRVKITRIRGIVFGVVPEYQNKGAYSSMLVSMYDVVLNDPHLRTTELSWIGDYNPKMHALFRSLNATKTKLHFTYKKLL